jgi:hypothetical protein
MKNIWRILLLRRIALVKKEKRWHTTPALFCFLETKHPDTLDERDTKLLIQVFIKPASNDCPLYQKRLVHLQKGNDCRFFSHLCL